MRFWVGDSVPGDQPNPVLKSKRDGLTKQTHEKQTTEKVHARIYFGGRRFQEGLKPQSNPRHPAARLGRAASCIFFPFECLSSGVERHVSRGFPIEERGRGRGTHTKKEGVWGTGQTGLPDRRAPVREREGDVYFFCFLLSYRSFLFSLSPLSAGFFLSPSPRQPVTRGLSVVYEWGIIGESLGVKAQRLFMLA